MEFLVYLWSNHFIQKLEVKEGLKCQRDLKSLAGQMSLALYWKFKLLFNRTNQECFEEAFFPTLQTLASAPASSPLAEVDVTNVAELLIDLTRPSRLNPQGKNSQDYQVCMLVCGWQVLLHEDHCCWIKEFPLLGSLKLWWITFIFEVFVFLVYKAGSRGEKIVGEMWRHHENRNNDFKCLTT